MVDAAQAVAFLTSAGYANVGPIPAPPLTLESTGEIVGLTPLWRSIILLAPVAPDNSNFFLDYDEAQVQQMFVQFPPLAPQPHWAGAAPACGEADQGGHSGERHHPGERAARVA